MNNLEHLVGTMTIGDLASRSGRSVDEIVRYALEERRVAPTRTRAERTSLHPTPLAPAPPPSHKRSQAVAAAVVDTRSPASRDAYDSKVLSVLKQKKSWMLAQEVRREAGGTPLQARTALGRLLAEGKIQSKGNARATVYKA